MLKNGQVKGVTAAYGRWSEQQTSALESRGRVFELHGASMDEDLDSSPDKMSVKCKNI